MKLFLKQVKSLETSCACKNGCMNIREVTLFFVCGWMDGWRDGWSGAEVDGVNWFVRANELSPVNQGLMGYPGTCNLVRELEQVRQNMRHT